MNRTATTVMKLSLIIIATFALMIRAGDCVAAVDAAGIMHDSNTIKRVDDEIATLTFHFIATDETEKQVVYTMVWKNMAGKKGYDNKAIFFTESPLDRKGVGYLGWLHSYDSDEADDEWIYLPELRMTRRLVPHQRGHKQNDDEFGRSLLNRDNLDPRPSRLDEYRLAGEETYENQPHYQIGSTPRQGAESLQTNTGNDDTPVARRVYWVNKDTLRISRVQSFDAEGNELLDIKFHWIEKDGYWLWQRVEATAPASGDKTVLEISDIKINNGLNDRVFSKRILEQGGSRFH